MTTIKQSLMVDGQSLSNNDPDLVIKLDSHPGVQISNIADDAITYSFAGDVTEDTIINLNLTFTYKGLNRLVVPMKFTQTAHDPVLVVNSIPLSVNIFQEGDEFPFTITDASGDITATVKDVVITPTSYVTTTGGKNWFIDDAPNAGVAAKVKYAFTVTSGGVDLPIISEATFDIPAWDGQALKVTNVTPFGATIGAEEIFEATIWYKGKFDATKATLTSLGQAGGYMSIAGQTPGEAGKLLIRVNGTAQTYDLTTTLVFTKVNVGGGSTAGKDYVNINVTARSLPDKLNWFNANGDPTGPYNGVGYQSAAGQIYRGGKQLQWDDPDIEATISMGTAGNPAVALEVLGGDANRGILYRILGTQVGTRVYHNLLSLRLKSNPGKYQMLNNNIWVSVTNVGVTTARAVLVDPVVPGQDNNLHFKLVHASTAADLKLGAIQAVTAVTSPTNGNALMGTITKDKIVYDSASGTYSVPIKSGHTGDAIQLWGCAGLTYIVNSTLVAPKSPVAVTLDKESYDGSEDSVPILLSHEFA